MPIPPGVLATVVAGGAAVGTPPQSGDFPATVVIGSVSPDDTNALYTPQTDGTVPTRNLTRSNYKKHPHVYMMPLTSPGGFQGQSVAFVQLAAPTLVWKVEFTAGRAGAQPQVPNSAPVDSNWVLLWEELETFQITLMPDGVSPLYSISGVYYYGHKNLDPTLVNNIAYPRPPWIDDDIDRSQPLTNMLQNLITAKSQRSASSSNATPTTQSSAPAPVIQTPPFVSIEGKG